MKSAKILWADDEIDLLMPHVLFLEAKGHKVVTANSGDSAIELINKYHNLILFS